MMNKLTENVASVMPKFEIPTFEMPESAFAAMKAATDVQQIVNPLSEVIIALPCGNAWSALRKFGESLHYIPFINSSNDKP